VRKGVLKKVGERGGKGSGVKRDNLRGTSFELKGLNESQAEGRVLGKGKTTAAVLSDSSIGEKNPRERGENDIKDSGRPRSRAKPRSGGIRNIRGPPERVGY